MGVRTLRVAARSSPLSRAQVAEAVAAIRPLLPGVEIESIFTDTPGDRDRTTPLSDPSVPDDFFTRDLDRMLLKGRCDVAVHSAKDLPRRRPSGLAIVALLPGRDPRDAVVFRAGVGSADVARVGSSAPRRDAAVRTMFPRAVTVPLRGNIEQRLAALDRGEFDAIVVAACALERLGLAHRISGYLPGDTAPLQGHLALTARIDANALFEALRVLDFRRSLFDRPEELPPRPEHVPPGAVLALGTRPERFARLGAVAGWTMIRREPRPLAERVVALEREWTSCDAVVFASAFAVRAFAHSLMHWRDMRVLAGRQMWAVGPATADAMERMGLAPDAAIGDMGGMAALAAALPAGAARRCLYPCSNLAPADQRKHALAARGVTLVPSVFYDTLERDPGPLPAEPFAGALFTSPSTVRSYFRRYPSERSARRRWIAIGAATLAALRSEGLEGELLHDTD